MVTLALVLATVVMPFSVLILMILLFPWTPAFVLKRLAKYLWEFSLNLNGYVIKLVHLMLAVSLILVVSKGSDYYEVLGMNGDERGGLTIDQSMKFNKAGRDFFIICCTSAVWIYIWRVIPLVSKLVS